MPALARWLAASGAVAVAALGLHWRLNARGACSRQHRSPRQRLKRPVSRPAFQRGFFRPGRLCCRCARLRDIAAPITIKEDRVTATTPQAVDARLTRSAIFLVATLNPGPDAEAAARPVRRHRRPDPGSVRAADDTLSCVMGIGTLSCVMGIGSRAWDRLFARRARRNCIRSVRSTACITPRHARRPAVPPARRAHGPLFRAVHADHGAAGRRVTVADTAQGFISTTATCSASSTARKTRWPRPRATPR